jgi:hypothetical protein
MLSSHLLLCSWGLGQEEAVLLRTLVVAQEDAAEDATRRGGPYPLYAMSLTDMLRPAGLAGEERFMRRMPEAGSVDGYCRWPCLKRERDERDEEDEGGCASL